MLVVRLDKIKRTPPVPREDLTCHVAQGILKGLGILEWAGDIPRKVVSQHLGKITETTLANAKDARAGLAKPPGRTPGVHVDAVRRANPEAGAAFAEVVERFYALRYGGERGTREGRAAAAALVARLRAALGRGYT